LVFAYDKEAGYTSIEDALRDLSLSRIGMADTRLAPYGMAAEQFILQTGLKDSLEERLIIGESIGQINQYLTTGAVDAAFTSYSFRIENEDRFGFFEVDPNLFDPIEQGAMVLNRGKSENAGPTEKLKLFLSSAKCKAVLSYFGYLVN
jgi:molybdate transport system substrate-binding protein